MSDIGVEGEQNRVAGRDYLEINLGSQDREPLAQAQRARLNEEVARLAEELGMDPRMLWRSVHESAGVKTVGEVRKDQYQDAMSALQAVSERHKELVRSRTLTIELEQATTEKRMAKQLGRFCLREFGEQNLGALTIMQLTQALRYVDECQAPPQAALSWHSIRAVVMSNPLHFTAVFVLGVSIGKVF